MMDQETIGCTILLSLLLFAFIGIFIYFLYVLQQRVCDVMENNEHIEETDIEATEEITENSAVQFTSCTEISEGQEEACPESMEIKIPELRSSAEQTTEFGYTTPVNSWPIEECTNKNQRGQQLQMLTFDCNKMMETDCDLTKFRDISNLFYKQDQALLMCV